jgi:hypothetical protein
MFCIVVKCKDLYVVFLRKYQENNRKKVEKITLPCPHSKHTVLPLYDLTMLNSAVSSLQHQITLR